MIYAGCFGPVTPVPSVCAIRAQLHVGQPDLPVAVLFVQLLGGAPNALT